MWNPNSGEELWGQVGLRVPRSHWGLERGSVQQPRVPGGDALRTKGEWGIVFEEGIDWEGGQVHQVPALPCPRRALLCSLTVPSSS